MIIQEVILYRVQLPLPIPYKVAFKTYTTFDPYIVEGPRSRRFAGGWGEAHIPEGYSKKETPAVGWDFCCAFGEKITGMTAVQAKDTIAAAAAASPMAATALVTALEAIEDNPIFRIDQDVRIPLLEPLRAKSLDQIPDEVERIIERGIQNHQGQGRAGTWTRISPVSRRCVGRPMGGPWCVWTRTGQFLTGRRLPVRPRAQPGRHRAF